MALLLVHTQVQSMALQLVHTQVQSNGLANLHIGAINGLAIGTHRCNQWPCYFCTQAQVMALLFLHTGAINGLAIGTHRYISYPYMHIEASLPLKYYLHTHRYTCTHTQTNTHTYKHHNAHYVQMHAHRQTPTHTSIIKHMSARMCARVHIFTHTHTHTHTYTPELRRHLQWVCAQRSWRACLEYRLGPAHPNIILVWASKNRRKSTSLAFICHWQRAPFIPPQAQTENDTILHPSWSPLIISSFIWWGSYGTRYKNSSFSIINVGIDFLLPA